MEAAVTRRTPSDVVEKSQSQRGRFIDVIAMLVYLALGFLIQANIWIHGAANFSTPRPDSETNVALTGWFPYALLHGLNPLLNPTMAAPHGINMLSNPAWPLLSALATPFTIIWGPIFSWNLLCTLALPLAATSTYFLCRRFVNSRGAAFVGGLLFGFSAYEIAALYGHHLQSATTALLPLSILCLCELLSPRRLSYRSSGLLLSLSSVGEFFISSELFAVEVFILAVGFVLALLLIPELRRRAIEIGKGLAVASGLGAMLLLYPIWFYRSGPQSVNGPVQLVAQAYRIDLLAFFLPTSNNALAPASITATSDQFSNALGENGAYLGIGLILFAIAVVIWQRRDRKILVIATTTVTASIMSLGASLMVSGPPGSEITGGLLLPEGWLAKLPALADLIPSKFAVYCTLGVALIAAIGLDRLLQATNRSKGTPLILVLLVAVFLIPMIPSAGRHRKIDEYHQPAFFRTKDYAALTLGSPILTVPYPAGKNLTAMRWLAQEHYGFSMPSGHVKVPEGSDGHVAFNPDLGYGPVSVPALILTKIGEGIAVPLDEATKSSFLLQLHLWHTRAVVTDLASVHNPNLMRTSLISILGPPTGGPSLQPYWLLPQ
ncbi:MAG: hypothetical protein NT160_02750 [Actinobacteria bacterium]|nr:hypothetical protein [Actinomycetota bacterium]